MYDFYVSEYLELNPGKTIEDFIDYFFIEEDPESDFTMPPQDTFELAITKKVHEWIEEAPDNKPIYLCHEEW